jgi:hypothetical protein
MGAWSLVIANENDPSLRAMQIWSGSEVAAIRAAAGVIRIGRQPGLDNEIFIANEAAQGNLQPGK